MKKYFSLIIIVSTLALSGCSPAPQNESISDGQQTSGTTISSTEKKIAHYFTHNTVVNMLTATVPELGVELIFDYGNYTRTCPMSYGTGGICLSNTIFDVEHYTKEPIAISGNTLYNTFTLADKEPTTDINKFIAERFNFSLSRCPLTNTGSKARGRLFEDETSLYTINYERFRTESGVIDPNAVERICGGLMGYEVYYSPKYPDRVLIEQAGYEKREDALFDFLYMKYTDTQ